MLTFFDDEGDLIVEITTKKPPKMNRIMLKCCMGFSRFR